MEYELDNGKRIDLSSKKAIKIGSGENGDVYKWNDVAVKIFKESRDKPIDKKTAQHLKIKTDRICLPKQLLYNKCGEFCGYTRRLVEKQTSSRIITLPKDVLVNNIEVLEKDIEILSLQRVLLDGIKPESTIFNGKLYITDATAFKILESELADQLENLNKYQLHLLLIELIDQELKRERNSGLTSAKIKEIKDLFGSKPIQEADSSDFFDKTIPYNNSVKQFVKSLR